MIETVKILVADYDSRTPENLASVDRGNDAAAEGSELPVKLGPVVLKENGELFDVSGNAIGHFELAWDWEAGNVPRFNLTLWPVLDAWICVPPSSSDRSQRLPADRLIIDLSQVIEEQKISDMLIQHVRSILNWVTRWGPPPQD